jgi:hypothetical protein
MTDWEYRTETLNIPLPGYQSGLKGVWDHMVEVVLHKSPRLIQRDQVLSLSFWMKAPDTVQLTGFCLIVDAERKT